MAKKGRQAKARSKKKAATPKLPDRRAMEGAMWGMFGRRGAGASPLDQAQEIMYQAFDEDDPEHRVALANVLWGEREEAVEHLQEMLRLNPNDNQGVLFAQSLVKRSQRSHGHRGILPSH